MKCPKCGAKMAEKRDNTPEGIGYSYLVCSKCGEELVTMKQLHSVAKGYREMRKYTAKISKWGESFAMRIPKELVKQYELKQNKDVTLIPEKKGIKIVA